MPLYTGINDPNLPQAVKDESGDYLRSLFVFWNNSVYRKMSSDGYVDPQLSDVSEDYGLQSMNSYKDEGVVIIAGVNTGAT